MIFSLSNITKKLTPDPETNILILLKEANLTLGGMFCIYNKLNSDSSLLVGITNEMESIDDSFSDNPTGHICYEATIKGIDKPVVISDMSKTEYIITDSAVKKLNLKSYLGVPVKVGGKTIGSLAIVDTVIREFDKQQINSITGFALLIALLEEHLISKQELLDSERKYQTIFKSSNDGLMILKNNVIVDANKKIIDLTGHNKSFILGKTIQEIFSYIISSEENKEDEILSYFKNALAGKPQRFELEYILNNGKVFNADISLSKLDGGKDYNLFVIIRDNNERKKYEKQLILEKDNANHANRLKSISLASMSHELRTPLNSIIGFSDLLLDSDTTEEEKDEFSLLIQTAGKSLMQLIGDIIDISKIEAGEVTIKKENFNVNNLLKEILLTFKHQKESMGKDNIELKLIIPDKNEEPEISSDANRLRQVFNNLIANSLKFVEEGYIEFGYSCISNSNIQFFVKDTGVGIKPDKKEVIFTHYGQDKSNYNRNKGGTGLGLAISKSFVELLGGEIWLDSELNKGTTFYFTIPLNYSTSLDKNTTENNGWSNATILIADDVKQNYLYLKGLLQSTNAKILWAKHGEEAVNICRNNPVNVVLMDLRMPVMDGFEAINIIKKENASINIIVQTAFSISEAKKEELMPNISGYLTKPINRTELFESLNKILK